MPAGLVLAALLFYLFRLQREISLLRELFEQAPQAIALTTIDDRVIRINKGFTKLFGYAPGAAIDRRLSELIIPAESHAGRRRPSDLVADGQRVDTEAILCRRDGSQFPAAVDLGLFSLGGQKTVICAAYRDIAKRRQEEEEARASELRWRAVFENSVVGISVTDKQGKFIATNRAYQEMLGYSERELAAKSYMDLTFEEDRPASAAMAAQNWAGHRPKFQLAKRYLRKDGQTIWVRVTVSRSGAGKTPEIGMAMVEDITEQKRAEARLLEYERVVEGLHEMIVVVDRDYRYLLANQAFLHYHGLEREQVVGRTAAEVLGQEPFDAVIKPRVDECLQGRVVKYEMTFTYSELGQRDLYATYFPIEGPAGIDRIAVVLEDISERKKAERELQRSFQELQALNAQLQHVREEEGTRLARELHDRLGQALTAIKLELASIRAGSAQETVSAKIVSAMHLVDETIRAVRRISTELRPGILDDLGLAAALEWAAEEFQSRTGIACRLDLADANLPVDSKRSTALFRIFQEALTNIARHAGATEVRVALCQEGGYLSLTVRDNGRGIDAERLSASGALGILGMRERAILLKGAFRIASHPDGGTMVSVRIPAGGFALPEGGP
ncbi:MAG: PAS domain S-box protein [Bryobacteraceae bacterium]